MGRRWSWCAEATILVALATGCQGSGETLPLDVTVRQGRVAATRGMIEIGLAPAGSAPVEITSLRLEDPRFAQVPPTRRDTTVDRLLYVPVDIGQAICGSPAASTVAAVALGVPGSDEPVTLPLDAHGDEQLAQRHQAACKREAVLDAVAIRFAPSWRPTGQPATARGALTLDRLASQEPITLAEAQGTVIFVLEVPGRRPGEDIARLGRGEDHVEVPVEVSAARCDPHALIESKRTYVFQAWVAVGDDEPVFLTVEPHGRARVALEQLLTRGCGIE